MGGLNANYSTSYRVNSTNKLISRKLQGQRSPTSLDYTNSPAVKESFHELSSKIDFQCARAPYDKRQLSVKKFLHHWEERNANMVYDWHRDVVQGYTTSLT